MVDLLPQREQEVKIIRDCIFSLVYTLLREFLILDIPADPTQTLELNLSGYFLIKANFGILNQGMQQFTFMLGPPDTSHFCSHINTKVYAEWRQLTERPLPLLLCNYFLFSDEVT